ncbi:MAG: leucine-rich repeat protein [Ruminococcus flavefaciens]|nr:leucine-rich repeat protein [Ruminococcus flavefaciens]
MKKRIKTIISFVMLVSMFFTTMPIQAEESGSAALKIENSQITVTVGNSFEIPLLIENNPGIMGLDIIIEYDKNYVEPVEVRAGDVLENETVNDSIDTSTTDSFHVMWAGVENITGNGELFTVAFNLKRNSENGNTNISFQVNSEDTYNESYESVTIDAATMQVMTTTDVIIKKQPALAVYMDDWTVGEKASTPVLTGNVENGKVTYEYSDAPDGIYSEEVPTQAGKYYLRANVAETDNYQSGITSCTFKILEKTSTPGETQTPPIETQVPPDETQMPPSETQFPSDVTEIPQDTTQIPGKGAVLKDNKNISYKVLEQGKTVALYKLGNKAAAKVNIPAAVTLNGITYRVTAVSDNAFSGCRKLKSVSLGKNITSIGNKAFYQCVALKKIVIPASVVKIGKQAFYGAKKLKSVKINSRKLSSKSVGSNAFKNIHKKALIKVPGKKKKAYQKWLKKKGIAKTVRIK